MYTFVCFHSVKQKSREVLLAGRLELEDREKHREELQVVCVWLEAADSLLSDMEQCNSTQELQVTPHSEFVFNPTYSCFFSFDILKGKVEWFSKWLAIVYHFYTNNVL